MALTKRSDVGRKLTIAEMDGNWDHVVALVDAINANLPTALEITNVTQSADGSTFTLWRSDGLPLGPITIPDAVFEFVGEWAASTGYSVNNWFTYERAGLYRVVQNHVSELSFDPTEENSDGRYYGLVMELFSGSAVKTVATTSYSPVLLDANRYIRFTNATSCLVTIPLNADVEFPTGTELHGRQAGAGQVSVEGDVGVTINASRPDYGTETPWQGANFTLKKVDTNTWDFIGPGSESTA